MPERLPTVQVRDETARRSRSRSRSSGARSPSTSGGRDRAGAALPPRRGARENDPVDRWITARLYEGNPLTRLGQYGLLGLGTVRTLRALGIEPGVLHFNEGHPALAALELAAERRRGRGADRRRPSPPPRALRLHDPHPGARRATRRTRPRRSSRRSPSSPAARDRRGDGSSTSAARIRASDEWPGMTPLALRLSRRANARQHAPRRGRARDVAAALRHASGRRGADHATSRTASTCPTFLAAAHARAARPPPRRRLARPRVRPGDLGAGRRHSRRGALGRPQRARARRSSTTSKAKTVQDRLAARRGPRRTSRLAAETFAEDTLTLGFARRIATYKRLSS